MQQCNNATMQQCLRYLLIVLFFVFSPTISIFAQSGDCSSTDTDEEVRVTYPWYGNDTFLPQFLADEDASRGNQVTHIPIQFIVVLTNAETLEGALPNNFGFLMNTINEGYQRNGLNFNFVMLCPKIIRRSNTATSNTEDFGIVTANNTFGAVNVIIRTGDNSNYYTPIGDYISLTRTRDANTSNAVTFVHELGHYFGLDHTHAGHLNGSGGTPILPCRKEDVRRDIYAYLPVLCNTTIFTVVNRWCNTKGDGFCDTPADPSPSLLATATDNFGQTFFPEKKNYMSYYQQQGVERSLFSNSQRGAILFRLKNRLLFGTIDENLLVFSLNSLKLDKYERDNSARTSKEIILDEVQNRTLLDGLVMLIL
jgi:hypothetical protein